MGNPGSSRFRSYVPPALAVVLLPQVIDSPYVLYPVAVGIGHFAPEWTVRILQPRSAFAFRVLIQADIIGSFDTATACEKAREFMLDKISDPQFQTWTKANAEKHGQKFDKKAGDQRTLSSRCVSSDDPRLKSK